jgi:hypothetical protein
MTKQEFTNLLTQLVSEGLVTFVKSKPVFTDLARSYLSTQTQALIVKDTTSAVAAVIETWEDKYKYFILGCQVPAKGYDSQGNPYAMNNFSKEGLKVFTEIVNAGYDLEVLAIAVTLYYKSKLAYKKAIGNYLVSREWITLYDQVIEQRKQGTLKQLIKDETAPAPSRYIRGK